MKLLLLSLLVTVTLFSQSFYVLTGVNDYDALIESPLELEIYKDEIHEAMLEMSKELKVNTAGHPSRVLALVISKFSVGETIAYKVDLELGEYMKRGSDKGSIFALSYIDTKMFKQSDDVEEDLMDSVEELLSRFSHQYKDDNKDKSYGKVGLTHENFAEHMDYETEYAAALAKAKKEGKPLFIFMTTSYCPWCRKLENRMLSKKGIDKKIQEKYVPAMLNFSKKNFPEQFKKVAIVPALYIVDSKTEKILHQFVGYHNRGEFLQLLDK